MHLAGDTQNVDISWCEHASGAGELLLLLLVLHAVICSFAGQRAPSTSSLIAARGRLPFARPFDFLQKLFATTRSVTSRTRHSDGICAATLCASVSWSLHFPPDYFSPTTYRNMNSKNACLSKNAFARHSPPHF